MVVRPQRGRRPELRRSRRDSACGRRRSGSCRSARPTCARWTRSSTWRRCRAVRPQPTAAATSSASSIGPPTPRSSGVNYTFKPDLNLDFYGEPFAASGRYDSLGELAAARTRAAPARWPRTCCRAGDFQVRSFRSNLVLRWEWRPGSFFYLVWQQNRAEEETTPRRAPRLATCSGRSAPAATTSSP